MDPAKRKALLKDIKTVVSVSLPDEELEVKAESVEKELQAIDQALADEGTYLGIVDKVTGHPGSTLCEQPNPYKYTRLPFGIWVT